MGAILDATNFEEEASLKTDRPSVFHGKALLVHPQKEVADVLKRSFETMGLDVEVHYEAMKAREALLSSDFDLFSIREPSISS